MVLGEDFREFTVAEQAFVVLSGPKTRTSGSRYRPEQEVVLAGGGGMYIFGCGAAIGIHPVAGAGCRYTCSSGGQDTQQRPGPTMGLLATMEALAVNVLSHG